MTTAAIVAISVLAYLVAGMAVAVLTVLNDGEPPVEDQGYVITVIVLFWPVNLMIDGPIWIVRWIRARRAARCEKPRVFEEYDEP